MNYFTNAILGTAAFLYLTGCAVTGTEHKTAYFDKNTVRDIHIKGKVTGVTKRTLNWPIMPKSADINHDGIVDSKEAKKCITDRVNKIIDIYK